MQRTRTVDPTPKIEALRRQREEWDAKIRDLESRHWVSNDEAAELKRLKLLKLQAKETIDKLASGHA